MSLAAWWRRRRPVVLPPEEAYDLWAPRYPPEPHNTLMRIEDEAVGALLPVVAGRHALDAACGSGRYLVRLRNLGAAFVVGADVSAAMVAEAGRGGHSVVRADIRRLPFATGAFDLIVCGLAIGHVVDLAGAMTEFARLLRPHGHLVWSDIHPAGARAGWQRTFRSTTGRLYAVTHHIHDVEDHQRACAVAGLRIDDIREPLIDFDHPWRGRPAVLAMRVRREA